MLERRGTPVQCPIGWTNSKISSMILDMVKECGVVRNFGNPIFLYRMGCKIRGLRYRIIKIHKSAKYLKHLTCVLDLNAFNAFNEENAEDKRERSIAFLKETQHVGIDNGIEQITDLILSEEDCHQVIAVLGMGGMGKTFLVQHVFKSQKVKQCFNYMVWLALSPSFMVKQLLREMCRQIKLHATSDEIQGLRAEDLITEIHEYLKAARCLFVLDDVWERDVWRKIGFPFQNKYKIVRTAWHKKVVEILPMLSAPVLSLPMLYAPGSHMKLEQDCSKLFQHCTRS